MAKNEKSAAAEKIEAAEKVKAKKPKSDKPNIFVRIWKAIVRFFRDLRGETKKIIWPDGKTVLKSTGVVLAVVAVFAIVIGLIDLGLSSSIDALSNAIRNRDNTSVSEQATEADSSSQSFNIDEDTAAADTDTVEEVTGAVEIENAPAEEAAEEAAAEDTTPAEADASAEDAAVTTAAE